jgi:hypothetical protein
VQGGPCSPPTSAAAKQKPMKASLAFTPLVSVWGGYVGLLPLVAFNRCLALVGILKILKCSCPCSRCICCLSTCPWILLGRAAYHVPFYGSQRDGRLPVSALEGAFGYDDFRSRWIMSFVFVHV